MSEAALSMDEVAADGERAETTALTRNIEHLDQLRWMQAIALSAMVRTTLQHPLNVAAARKRVHRDYVPLRTVLAEGYSAGGTRALYRGLGVCIAGNVIGECLYLGALEHTRHRLPFESTVVRDALGGAAGDAASLVVCTPFAVVCNRQMTAGYGMASKNVYESVPRTVARLARSEQGALRSLYAGFAASLYVLPASGVWWGSYGVFKEGLYAAAGGPLLAIAESSSKQSLLSATDNPAINGCAGVLAALATATVTNPFNVVRTRMQVGTGDAAVAGESSALLRRSKIARVCADLVRNEGYGAFLKGLRVNAAVAAFDGLLFSSVYELTKW
eukprot:CAMPEP_0174844270 /NCGR_PEP_ID=MMETSP1114-20130205/11002_1 /TAXON_ID=312471 /ORGANISM="Neobodo designis, Strain CCAP 1951/1" /LENGTH=330 /DNA_ID=CAMNT_0016078505 /DNA_START=30 /DNA_END=1019 /DNA_ORIENTATION=+